MAASLFGAPSPELMVQLVPGVDGVVDTLSLMIIWVQRIENLALAALIALTFIVAGFSWWWLFVLFLVFDLSALGYIKNARVGAWWYNAVHNYTLPALLAVGYGVSVLLESPIQFFGFLAGCWAFHVAVDRALGYGLKLVSSFTDTHLGTIGNKSE